MHFHFCGEQLVPIVHDLRALEGLILNAVYRLKVSLLYEIQCQVPQEQQIQLQRWQLKNQTKIYTSGF